MTDAIKAALCAALGVTLCGGAALAARRRLSGRGTFQESFEYEVRPGDTLSALGFKFFGDARLWTALRDSRGAPLSEKRPLQAGARLFVPCVWVEVAGGESLADVAERVLGDARRWRRVHEANKAALPDPDKLVVGQRLAVPMALPSMTGALAAPATSVGAVFGGFDGFGRWRTGWRG